MAQSGRSQRDVYGHSLSWRAGGGIALLLICSGTSIAEVCDKVVGEDWRRGDGPMLVVGPEPLWKLMLALAVLMLGAAALVALFLAWMGAGRWLTTINPTTTGCLAGALYCVLLLIWALHDRVYPYPNPIMRVAAEEGCVSLVPAWLDFLLPAAFAALFGWATWRSRLSRVLPIEKVS
jgi:hypothetical protein